MPQQPMGPSAEDLIRMICAVFSGVRRPRLLADHLGWEARAVQRAWELGRALDLLDGDAHLRLRPAGLRVAATGPGLRRAAYARAVAQSSLVHAILDDPDPGALKRALRRRGVGAEPLLSERAAALRVLIRPALTLPELGASHPRQATLPLPAEGDPPAPPPVDLRCGTGENPDTYALIYSALLGAGELSGLQLRALLDRAEGAEVELAPLIEMGLRRGDLIKMEDRLVLSAEGQRRAQLAEDGAWIALSDPEYRRWLELSASPPRPAEQRAWEGLARRFLHWDARLWGESLAEAPQAAARGHLPPAAGGAPTPPLATTGGWLQHLDAPGLPLAFPRHLALLGLGLRGINPLLRPSAAGPRRPPSPVDLPLRVHAGLLSPGDKPLRAVADGRALRLRALERVPALGLLGAALLLHRRVGGLARVRLGPAGPTLCAGRRVVGPLVPALLRFCADQGWAPLFAPQFSVNSAGLVHLALRGRWASRAGPLLCLDEELAATLGEDDEGRLVLDGLEPLMDRLWAWLGAEVGALRSERGALHAEVPHG